MSAVVWANVLLAIPFLIAFIAIPLWITLRRQSAPDHTQAHAYLGAKAALAEAETAPVTSGAWPSRRPVGRTAAGRRSAATARRDHARQAARHAGASV
jgi:Tfp pilus assembly protein PilX